MATISVQFPSQVASVLNALVPGFADASKGGDTVALQVPAAAQAAPVAVNLNNAGGQAPAAAGNSGAPVVVPDNAAAGLAQYAPAGLVPQGQALESPDSAGAVAFAQTLGQRASDFFEQAANGGPISQEQFATFASQQNAAVTDYIFAA